jgi:hypothetical protein
MYLTVANVEEAIRRLHKLRREVMEQRAQSSDPEEIERCHLAMAMLRQREKERLDILRRVKRGEKIR